MAEPVAPDLPTLAAYVAWWAEAAPDREAAVLEEERLSYRALAAAVDAHACALLAAGIAKGDRVATLAPPGIDFLVTYLATTRIGGIWLGLNPKYRRDELVTHLRDAEPRLLFLSAGEDEAVDLAALRSACPGIETVVTLLGRGADRTAFLAAGAVIDAAQLQAAVDAVRGEDVAAIVYTSGSTGKPKGAMLTHRGIVAFARGQNAVWPLDPVRVLNYFPINHVGCLNDISAPALVAGGMIVFLEKFDARHSLVLMERERITFWASVPSVFQLQLAVPDFATFDLSAVQLIVWEGAAMTPETIARLRAVHPALATNYGMTETTSAITVLPPTDDLDRLAASVGGAFPGVEIRLADAGGAASDEGEVQARSALNCAGYWRNPEATATAFTSDGFFRTGDLAVRRPDGLYRIVGRLKEMFKSGGYNVYPREIEDVLEAHPGVTAAAVIGVPDPTWDEIGIAFVAGTADADALSEWCRARLANYKVPKRIVVEAALPLLPIGKIDKPALKQRALALITETA